MLVKGYRVDHGATETLFAVYSDGRVVKTTKPVPFWNTRFHVRGRKWQEVSSLPPKAEYIGEYPMF